MSVRDALSPAPSVERRILFIRGQRVMLDADLAALYGVSTRVLNQLSLALPYATGQTPSLDRLPFSPFPRPHLGERERVRGGTAVSPRIIAVIGTGMAKPWWDEER